MQDDLKLSEMRRRMEQAEETLAAALARIKELETDVRAEAIRRGQAELLLDATAAALKGEPDPRRAHVWHDLPEWSKALRDVTMYYLAATAPGATHIERENFVLALSAWRALFGRDMFETACAFAELDK